jgi:hydroxymethylbilane synthase
VLRVATRGSALARWQAARTIELLGNPPHELVIVSTTGDERRDVAIQELGGSGVFVKEVQDALLTGQADVAVHSAKDLPGVTPDGLVIAAFPERADPRDALVGTPLAQLAEGATVGTGAVRRRVQLAHLRPDLHFAELRGNIPTRLEKATQFDAIVVAVAALDRLARRDAIAEILEPEVMLPQVGQGALAVECRADDREIRELLVAVDDAVVRPLVDAERSFLAELGGSCELPVGALAHHTDDGRIALDVMRAQGRSVFRARVVARPSGEIGAAAVAALDRASPS